MTTLRDEHLTKIDQQDYDVLIIGGGINGAVSAASLAARGAKVAVIDRGDFAGETSSHSSNLVWGGIKYLESHEYRLVSKLCKSRNHLNERFPSTVKEIRFLTTIQKGFRLPSVLVYLGTLLYWAIGRFFTQAPRYLNPQAIKNIEPNIDIRKAQGGFEYSDCYLFDNDARFVFNFIRSAMDHSATALNYVEAKTLEQDGQYWRAQLFDSVNKRSYTLRAKVVINACGPFVDTFNRNNGLRTQHRHVFSKGIHLIVDRLTSVNKVLAFFAADGRLFFVIPMGPKTCIGTTDTKVPSPHTQVSDEDRDFVIDNVNRMLDLDQPLTRASIIAERCAVRPLAITGQDTTTDWVQLSRKHAIDIDKEKRFVSIFGGKLTDCINVGNEVAARVEEFGITLQDPQSPDEQAWYGESPAPQRQAFMAAAAAMSLNEMSRPDIHEKLSDRLWRRYDKNAFAMLDAIRKDKSQADIIIPNTEYRRCELHYIAKHELVTKLDDFLRRRSKISLIMRKETLCQRKILRPACNILFAEKAEEKLDEYLGIYDT